MWRGNDEITSVHTEFEILMKYPNRTVQKIVGNAGLWNILLVAHSISPLSSFLIEATLGTVLHSVKTPTLLGSLPVFPESLWLVMRSSSDQ